MKEMVKLLPYIKQYKGMFAGGILLMICMVGFELAGPLIAATILDRHIKLGEGNIVLQPILYLIALFLTIKLLHAVTSYFAQIVLVSAGTRAIQKMRLNTCRTCQSGILIICRQGK